MSTADPSILRFRHVVASGLHSLEQRREEINDLNVFPVADGDTGDNMVLTLRAVLDELDAEIAEARSLAEVGRDAFTRRIARAALLGARGNSGVILSQLIAGAAEELISRPGELVGPALVSAGLAAASRRGYASVRDPAEGTILSVMREIAGTAAQAVARLDAAALEPRDAVQQASVVAAQLEEAVRAGQLALERGRDQHPVLREAGVVDSGGYGAVVIFAGVVAALRGGVEPEVAHHAATRSTRPDHVSETFRYCTNFALSGAGLDADAIRRRMEALGDSVLVVGDPHTLKVHVHTDDPDLAFAVAAQDHEEARVSHTDVADMRAQVQARAERLAASADGDTHEAVPAVRCGLLAVVQGDGVARAFRSLGASTVAGGPTMNPSMRELLAAVHDVPADEVVLLANSPNVVLAAEKVVELSDRTAVVVANRDQQGGLAASVGLDPSRGADENATAVRESLAAVRTGGVAPAAREDPGGRFGVGDALGYVAEELVAWGAPRDVLAEVLTHLGDGAELLTVLPGEGAPLDDDAVEALVPDGLELELTPGGQAAWWWLVAAE